MNLIRRALERRLAGENASYHAVIGGSPAHVQPLQQLLGQVDLLLSHVVPDVQAFAELPRRSLPIFIYEEVVAPTQQVAHQLCHELLEGAEQWKGMQEYRPNVVALSPPQS